MASKHWKNIETFFAKKFGGKRRGADFGGGPAGNGQGKNDVICDHWSVEIKHNARPTWSLMEQAVSQAETAARPGEEPVAIIHRKGGRYEDALVVQRFSTFEKWRL